MPALIDITGDRYGRLTVIERRGYKAGRTAWLCKCECGNYAVVTSNCLRRGHTKSCGCYHRETAAAKAKSAGIVRGIQMMKHGKCGTRLYGVWKSMNERCSNPNNSSFADYGGRGITVCNEWNEFQAFSDWAERNGYDETAPFGECTLDRINNNLGYSPEN